MASSKPVGRPMKFATVQGLKQKIDEYFGDCDPHIGQKQVWMKKVDGKGYWATEEIITEQRPYTITGLALALDTNRHTLLNYQEREHYPADLDDDIATEFINTIAQAKLRCHQYAEDHLFTGRNAAGAMFSLKNNYDWVDESQVKHSGTISEDLDSLEEAEKAKTEVSEQAAAELQKIDEVKDGEPRPEAEKQVVEADTPIQNKE